MIDKHHKTPLCLLFEKYGSDKCPKYFHTYSPHYYEILKDIRKEARLIIEIGVGNKTLMSGRIVPSKYYMPGASLRAWNDFFPNALVYGLDINTTDFFTYERVRCMWSDQSNIDILKTTINKIQNEIKTQKVQADLIIDDGSHIKQHMLLSFDTLKWNLKIKGFYIIEDIKSHELDIFSKLESSEFKLFKVYRGKSPKSPRQDCFVVYQRVS